MHVAILGAGAMGSLFGSLLSRNNEVALVDLNRNLVETINRQGIRVNEKDGSSEVFHPHAVTDASSLKAQDLVIVFVKSMFTESALKANGNLIGPNTFLMTLQNGSGHESVLSKFTDTDRIIIGSTQHNSSIVNAGEIFHGGAGHTSIGLLSGRTEPLESIAANFTSCGLGCSVSDNVQKQIWNKLFTNTAASSLTAVFQQPLGFLLKSDSAHSLMKELVSEAVEVANCLNLGFDRQAVLEDVERVCANAPQGYTSIYADIRDGRKTEVDSISGSVIKTAEKYGIDVPVHRIIVKIIHSLEDRE